MARTKQTARKTTTGKKQTPKMPSKSTPAKRPSKSTPAKGGKQHRLRPGTGALREIRKYQRSTKALIARRPFQRFLKGVTQRVDGGQSTRWTWGAVEAAREILELFLNSICENANHYAIHAKRVTVMQKDIQLATRACNNNMFCLALQK